MLPKKQYHENQKYKSSRNRIQMANGKCSRELWHLKIQLYNRTKETNEQA